MRPDQAKNFADVAVAICDDCHREYTGSKEMVESGQGVCPHCKCDHRFVRVKAVIGDNGIVTDCFAECVNCEKKLDIPVIYK